ncbi:uncharacterized protein LOC132903461 [Amyelois transitella]|uniref:uncharacterized protein LOC132903461 n=1 Tax=Amyelois transitella TaxID=680683 RepID=UPI00298FBA69|nr:uncharacterized protein LOC132903461 [Amyelois transitella]
MDVRFCVALLVLGGTLAFSGKGYYCRDPDTGKLHTVNSTWRSISFCGNYTCRLKRRDHHNEKPLREFQISDLNLLGTITPKTVIKSVDTKNRSAETNSDQEEKIAVDNSVSNKTVSENRSTDNSGESKRLETILHKLLTNISDANGLKRDNEIRIDDMKPDRYLNDKEIKIISDLLHSVKKSDLETVVDIYSLAQDIYKELDKKTTEAIIEESVSELAKKEEKTFMSKVPHTKLVYEYEPMYISQKTMTEIKNQEHDVLSESYPKIIHNEIIHGYKPIQVIGPHKTNNIADMHKEASEIVPSYNTPKFESPLPTHKPLPTPNYGQLPYYFQMLDFQRQSSSVHPSTNTYSTYPVTESSFTSEKRSTPPTNYKSNEHHNINRPVLLPYPYYQVRYNASGYPFNYFYGVNPYHDAYRKEYNPYYVTRTAFTNNANIPERSYIPGSLIDTLLPKDYSRNQNKIDWKTDSLSDDVLDEIRAHFESKNILFKPICLRKKVKLEKVAKVLKLHDNNREKRSTSSDERDVVKNDDIYEVYIESTTCLNDVDPGFFRMGNISAPYPACCPQRINR